MDWVVYPFFVWLTLPFWILVLAEFGFLFWCVSYRHGFIALASLVVLACLFQFFGDIPVLVYLWHNPLVALAGLGVWLFVSVPWAFTKWWMFVRDNSGRYDEILGEFLEQPAYREWSKDPNGFTADQKVTWKLYFDQHSRMDDWYEYNRVEFDPSPRTHKADIMTWMMFWPWSLLWTLLNDPIRKFFRHCYYYMVSWLESIRDYYWKDKRGHMPTQAEMDAYYQKQQEEAAEQRRKQQDQWRQQHQDDSRQLQ